MSTSRLFLNDTDAICMKTRAQPSNVTSNEPETLIRNKYYVYVHCASLTVLEYLRGVLTLADFSVCCSRNIQFLSTTEVSSTTSI